jgi:chromosomal replication initiator protein
LIGGMATPAAIEQALSPLAAEAARTPQPPAADAIIDVVCQRTGTQPRDLSGKSRSRDVTYARHLAMYILREDGHKTVAEICRLFGNRDHSTVLGGIQRITGELATRIETSADLAAVRSRLAAPVAFATPALAAPTAVAQIATRAG